MGKVCIGKLRFDNLSDFVSEQTWKTLPKLKEDHDRDCEFIDDLSDVADWVGDLMGVDQIGVRPEVSEKCQVSDVDNHVDIISGVEDDLSPLSFDNDIRAINLSWNQTSVRVQYTCDTRANHHGNRVWQASILMAKYLSEVVLEHINRIHYSKHFNHDRQNRGFEDGNGDVIMNSETGTTDKTAITGLESDLRILELGAGVGMPSLFLGHCINKVDEIDKKRIKIYLTDYPSYANITQMIHNVAIHPNPSLFHVAPLDWGAEGTEKFMEEECSQTDLKMSFRLEESKALDEECGQSECLKESKALKFKTLSANDSVSENRFAVSALPFFDYVIFSDCIYDHALHDRLLETVKRTLSPTGRAICSFSLHCVENVLWFFKTAESRGFDIFDTQKCTKLDREGYVIQDSIETGTKIDTRRMNSMFTDGKNGDDSGITMDNFQQIEDLGRGLGPNQKTKSWVFELRWKK